MATTIEPRNGGIIVFTLVIAMLLMMVPLPESVQHARPEWVVMTLLYWAMALPKRVGIGVAWVCGLLMDVMLGGTLGVLAFAYALATFIIARFHLQLRQYPLWQQALTILSVVLLVRLIAMLAAPVAVSWTFWLAALSSTLLWPMVYATLRKTRRVFRVS